MAKIRDTLTPEGKKFLAELEELGRMTVKVGFQAGEATDDNGVDLCDIAVWNELGTQGKHPIPAGLSCGRVSMIMNQTLELMVQLLSERLPAAAQQPTA